MLRAATFQCVVGCASNTAMSSATGAVSRAEVGGRGGRSTHAGACTRTGGCDQRSGGGYE